VNIWIKTNFQDFSRFSRFSMAVRAPGGHRGPRTPWNHVSVCVPRWEADGVPPARLLLQRVPREPDLPQGDAALQTLTHALELWGETQPDTTHWTCEASYSSRYSAWTSYTIEGFFGGGRKSIYISYTCWPMCVQVFKLNFPDQRMRRHEKVIKSRI